MEKIIELEMGTFTIRQYREDDEQKVLELWKIAFNKELPVDIWRWKYIDNPFGSVVYLCVDEKDRLATVMYGGVPYPANFSGRPVAVVQLMDIMSHPEYRKTGLFVKAAYAYFDHFGDGKGCPFVYGFPGQYHFEIGSKYLGYVRLESGMAYLEAGTEELSSSARLLGARVGAAGEIDSAYDGLWRKHAPLYPLSAVRDRAFIDWRFINHPSQTYTVLSCRNPLTGTLKGYAVLSIEKERAGIVDLLIGDDSRGIEDFLGRIGRWLNRQGVSRVNTWLPGNHFIAEAAVSAGFEKVPEPLGLIPTVKLFDRDLGVDWVSDNLYYTMADCDVC